MGRKIRKAEPAKTPASDRTLEMWARDVPPANVEVVRLPLARELKTLPINAVNHYAPNARGAIVRLKPTENDIDEAIDVARQILHDAGAAYVFTLPKPRGTVLPEEKVRHVRARSIREVVDSLVAESAFDDKPALRDAVEEIAASEGI